MNYGKIDICILLSSIITFFLHKYKTYVNWFSKHIPFVTPTDALFCVDLCYYWVLWLLFTQAYRILISLSRLFTTTPDICTPELMFTVLFLGISRKNASHVDDMIYHMWWMELTTGWMLEYLSSYSTLIIRNLQSDYHN